MKHHFVITRSKRNLWFYCAALFMLQTIAPAFQGVMAKSANGYTDTICTMNGPVTVFVKIEDEKPDDLPNCYECAICFIQANLNAGPVSHNLQLETHFRPEPAISAGPFHPIASLTLFPSFFSRAPPA